MKRILIPLFLSIALSCAKEKAPKQTIQTAEQALARFQEARKTDLKDLSDANKKHLDLNSKVRYLSVRIMQPRDYDADVNEQFHGVEAAKIIFGKGSAVSACKNETWQISYDTGIAGGMNVYLDSVTGKVLFIHLTDEG